MESRLCLASDFKDFYDDLCVKNNGIVYTRKISEAGQRGKDLRFLKSLGIPALDLKQVTGFSRLDTQYVVVYTDPKKHNSLGKRIMTLDEAYSLYPSYLASKFYPEYNGITLKYLQVGSKRFRLWYRSDTFSLDKGTLIKAERITDGLNRSIKNPIFSVDYIQVNDILMATDYNQVENLGALGVDRWISGEEVVSEILKALNAFNRNFI